MMYMATISMARKKEVLNANKTSGLGGNQQILKLL